MQPWCEPSDDKAKWTFDDVGESGVRVARLYGTPVAVLSYDEAHEAYDLLCALGSAKWCTLNGSSNVTPATVCALNISDASWSATVRPWRHGKTDKGVSRLLGEQGKSALESWFDVHYETEQSGSASTKALESLCRVSPDFMILVAEVDDTNDKCKSVHVDSEGKASVSDRERVPIDVMLGEAFDNTQ